METAYIRKYKRLEKLLTNLDVEKLPIYQVAFYGGFDSRKYRLIKETKVHFYFVLENLKTICRISKKSQIVKIFTPDYAYDKPKAKIVKKIEK